MKRALIIAGVGALLTACAATEESETDPVDDPRVGERVDRICFSRGITGFTRWKEADGLILTRGVNKKYAVTFFGRCRAADDAERIGVTDQFGAGCLTRGDSIYVSTELFSSQSSRPFATERCSIAQIFEWNEDAEVEDETETES